MLTKLLLHLLALALVAYHVNAFQAFSSIPLDTHSFSDLTTIMARQHPESLAGLFFAHIFAVFFVWEARQRRLEGEKLFPEQPDIEVDIQDSSPLLAGHGGSLLELAR
ncbi:uncharacterized protein VTP21DRAFT_10863 [Calcarisporiella thermophila]|uniref:uncharacterized protein n=1 Tax=Calcarisporiella thermophila TaxID=911321 RepID=UPI003744786A